MAMLVGYTRTTQTSRAGSGEDVAAEESEWDGGIDLSQRLNTEQRGDSTNEQATPRAHTSASAYAA